MATLTGKMPSRLSTQGATVAQMLQMFEEQQLGIGWKRNTCRLCHLDKPTKGPHTCGE